MGALRSSSVVALLLVFSWGAVATGQAASGADTPMETIRWSNDAILEILSTRDPLDSEGEAQIYDVMDKVTDFQRMSDAAIEGLCEADSEDCEEWKRVFGDLLRIRSIKGVGRYRADRFDYLNEEIDGEQAVVNCLAYFKKEDEEFALDYELTHVDNGWVIVNYVIDDVDTVRSYRRRFTRLLRNESVDQIIGRLTKRIQELEAES